MVTEKDRLTLYSNIAVCINFFAYIYTIGNKIITQQLLRDQNG